MAEKRTVTVFSIEDPDTTDTIADIVLLHEPLTQTEIELRLRAVAKGLRARTWADLGSAIAEGTALLEKELTQNGFKRVKEFPFFKVAGETKIAPIDKTNQGLLGAIAEAAEEPEDEVEELVSFVKDHVINESELKKRLDALVEDRMREEAASINDDLASQIEYLCRDMTTTEATQWLRENVLPPH